MTESEREFWVLNDETLRAFWQRSQKRRRTSSLAFAREHSRTIEKMAALRPDGRPAGAVPALPEEEDLTDV